jgi:hypothetical protein
VGSGLWASAGRKRKMAAAGLAKTKLWRMRAFYGAGVANQPGIAIDSVYTSWQIDLWCTR